MLSPIAPRIGAVFIPVSDIHAARDWYCRLLGLQPDGEVLFGHIYVLPMNGGSGLVLDSKDYAGPNDRKPLFHFATRDIVAAPRASGRRTSRSPTACSCASRTPMATC